MGRRFAELMIQPSVHREIDRGNDEGESLVGNLETGRLEGVSFSVDRGWVVWEPIGTPVS